MISVFEPNSFSGQWTTRTALSPILEFETVELASAYLRYLQEMVWANPDKAPALAGPPRAMILEPVVIV